MLRIDGKFYLAYSGEVPRDSPQALLLKRAWESLRRNSEFRHDYQMVVASDPRQVERLKAQFQRKWGVWRTDPNESFDKIVGEATSIKLDDRITFDDIYRRLYGDSFYGLDRVVQCEQLDHLYNLMNREDFERLSAIARGHVTYDAPLETLQRHVPAQPTIQVTIDVDQNPIAILYKLLFIIRVVREARVRAGKAPPFEQRAVQQLHTLEEQLDADIVGDGRRDFRHDNDVFKVWDLSRDGKTHDEIARAVWPSEYRRDRGVRNEARDRTSVGKRVRDYKERADGWIELFGTLVKNNGIVLPGT